jgi:hypothetical protein
MIAVCIACMSLGISIEHLIIMIYKFMVRERW